ncbi:ABC transporter substrate-binding protein [Natronosporangium hydrolyticum]|uniref:ABC transporter substrate-binding protein n=1 Tax=Natronosporangium hydrolyticum TaxID=2811111 RepID=A0A895YEL5_9ACTN|nr:ABC transporter substrate-binding protein [Natronosporangium hydrolyticum]QSB14592.1 ABC transporter substrate-binding protein [Natronosporangium hydrolyticum]
MSIAAVLSVVVVTLGGCGVFGDAREPAPMLIGVDLALTGSSQQLDEVHHRALLLRLEQVNEQRQQAGQARLELRVLDNRSDPATTVANVESFAASEVSAVVAGACVECALGAVDVIDELGVPVVVLAASTGVAEPVEARRFVFQLAPHPSGAADVMALELARAGAATVGVLTSDDEYGADGARELAAALAVHDIELVIDEPVAGDGLGQAVSRVAAWTPPPPVDVFVPGPVEPGPDAVVVWTSTPVLSGEIALALVEADFQGQLWLDPAAVGELVISGPPGQALDGARALFVETLVADQVIASLPHRVTRRLWFETYVTNHGNFHGHAVYSADALDVLAAAADAGGVERIGLRDALESTQLVVSSPRFHGAVIT